MNEFDNNDLEKLTADVLASYDKELKIRRIGETFLPSRSKIVEILEQVRRLLFPGYFGHKKLTQQNVRYHVGNLLVKLADELSEEICHCMCSDRSCEKCEDPEQCRRQAEQIAKDFIARVPQIRRMLGLDAQAAYDGDPAAKSIDEIVYCYPGFYAVTIYRLAHELLDLGVPLIPRIMTEYAHSQTGADIHPAATIGKSFFIDHATGVIIGETTIIGDNVKIYQGVTLGGKSFARDRKRHPTIEDDVTIYANATILGGDTVVGRGATVNGNVFITKSITADSTVTSEHPTLEVRNKREN